MYIYKIRIYILRFREYTRIRNYLRDFLANFLLNQQYLITISRNICDFNCIRFPTIDKVEYFVTVAVGLTEHRRYLSFACFIQCGSFENRPTEIKVKVIQLFSNPFFVYVVHCLQICKSTDPKSFTNQPTP